MRGKKMSAKTKKRKKKRKPNKRKKRVLDVFFLLFTLVGIAMLLYPFYSDYQLKRSQTLEIRSYEKNIHSLSKSEKEQRKKELASEDQQKKNGNAEVTDPFNDGSNTFDLKQSMLPEIVGVLEIPRINLKVPIYPTSNELALEKGVGVLEGSSSPLGGKGNHSVITGHRGLSLGQMFTDLPELKKKNQFYIKILGEVHAYEIDKITTIIPTDLSQFNKEEENDLITLVTCTPLGINSHRLLVRGHRVPYNPKKKDAPYFWTLKTILICAGAGLLVLFLLIILVFKRGKRRKARSFKKGGRKHAKKIKR
jgi:sortase A